MGQVSVMASTNAKRQELLANAIGYSDRLPFARVRKWLYCSLPNQGMVRPTFLLGLYRALYNPFIRSFTLLYCVYTFVSESVVFDIVEPSFFSSEISKLPLEI